MTDSKSRYQPGDTIGGRYKVFLVRMGGMGEVYLCLDLESNLPYALKTFQQRHQTGGEQLRHAFEQEVATWVALEKHPNIVRCFYMDIINNQPYVFLEWISGAEGKGADLRSWLLHSPLDLQLALDFTIDICRGLIHAQDKQPGIVHRDLKPKNILVDQGHWAKITDWGLAKTIYEVQPDAADLENGAGGQQRHSRMGGTLPYMAPEQWLGGVLDQRTDIYAVGCILYEMLTGHCPFDATTLDGLRHQHLEGPIPRLANGRQWPNTLDALLTTCLAKARNDRPTPAGLLRQLEKLYQEQFATAPRAAPPAGQFTAADHSNRGVAYAQLGSYTEALEDYSKAIALNPDDANVYANRSNTYRMLGRNQEAIADCNRAIALNPELAAAYNNRGAAYGELQDHAAALADYTRAIDLALMDPIVYFNRGALYDNLQEYDAAIADYSQAIALDPHCEEAYCNRGSVYAKTGQYDAALEDLFHAISLDPGDALAYHNIGSVYGRQGKDLEALRYFDHAAELGSERSAIQAQITRGLFRLRSKESSDPTEQAYAALQRATSLDDMRQAVKQFPFMVDPDFANQLVLALMQQKISIPLPLLTKRLEWLIQIKDELSSEKAVQTPSKAPSLEEKLADVTRAIQFNPRFAPAYLSRGIIYAELQRYNEAMTDYTQAIELDPALVDAYYNRARIHSRFQRYEQALTDYTQAIQLDPTDPEAYNNRGGVYVKLGRYAQAVADYTKAIQLDPTKILPYTNRGVVYDKLHRYDEALADYAQAIQLDPNNAAAYNTRGLTYADMGQYEKALSDYNQAIRLDSNSAQAYFIRGNLHYDFQRYHDALSDYTRAIQIDPKHARFYSNRGLSLAGLEKYREALADFTRAIQLDPTNARTYYNRGVTHRELGQDEKALSDYHQVIKLDPKYIDAYFSIGMLLRKRKDWREALYYFETAAQLGDREAAQYAAQIQAKLGS